MLVAVDHGVSPVVPRSLHFACSVLKIPSEWIRVFARGAAESNQYCLSNIPQVKHWFNVAACVPGFSLMKRRETQLKRKSLASGKVAVIAAETGAHENRTTFVGEVFSE